MAALLFGFSNNSTFTIFGASDQQREDIKPHRIGEWVKVIAIEKTPEMNKGTRAPAKAGEVL